MSLKTRTSESHFTYSPPLPAGESVFLSGLDATSFYATWKIGPVCRAHKDMLSTICSSQLLLLDLGMQNLRGQCTSAMKEEVFLKMFGIFLFTCAILQTLEQIPTGHNTFTSSLLGV